MARSYGAHKDIWGLQKTMDTRDVRRMTARSNTKEKVALAKVSMLM